MIRLLLTAALAISSGCAGPLWSGVPAQPPVRASAAADAARLPLTLPNADDSVKFLVIGDSGTGDRAQYQVAAQIAQAHRQFPFDFALMLGDNLYGSEGPTAYVRKFEQPYQPLLLGGVKFYASLGNHDEPAQRFYKPFNMNGKRYYSFRKGDAEFFALDSTYMTTEQVRWLQEALEGSDARWKIAYMHHPIYSSGERHGSERDLRVLVEPLFVENGVDVVFAGHEHFYERLKPQQGIHYFTQGGAAKLRRHNIRDNSPLTAKGFDTDRSFTLVEIVGDQLFFETISRVGQVVDSGSLVKTGSGVIFRGLEK